MVAFMYEQHFNLYHYIQNCIFTPCGSYLPFSAAAAAKVATTAVPADREVLPMDCAGFNPYHNPNEVRRFNIKRTQLLMDEVELGSGNFGCVKKGVLKTDS